MQHVRFPAVFMRGGTSKGLFFRGGVLPSDPAVRDAVLLASLGSPDPYKRQIDGLGGASSSTSKAVIVTPSTRPGADVDYLFAQVDVERPLVDYSANCGNLSGAVGPFAIAEGMVVPVEGITHVRIWQENTQRMLVAHVPVFDGEPVEGGDFRIAGVARNGAEIVVDFVDPGGALTGKLLPTGNAVDELDVPGVGRVRATLIDAGAAAVFVRAEDFGLTGTELRPQVDADEALLRKLEAVRAAGSVAMGLSPNAASATRDRPGSPKLAFVAAPRSYRAANGDEIDGNEIDLLARMISMGTLHHAFPGTGAVAVAVAAVVPGTIVNEVARLRDGKVAFGHTSGVVSLGATVSQRDGIWHCEKASVSRTARRLMQGEVCVPSSLVLVAGSPGGRAGS